MKIKNKKEYIARIKKIKNIFWWLGNNFFWGIIIFISLSIIAGSFVFYKYEYRIKQKEIISTQPILRFQELNYQNVLNEWSNRDEKINQIKEKRYIDPFDKILTDIPSPEEIEEIINEEINDIISPPEELKTYIIQPGDNLWILAERFLGSGFRWVEITDSKGEPYPDWRADVLRIGEKVLIPAK